MDEFTDLMVSGEVWTTEHGGFPLVCIGKRGATELRMSPENADQFVDSIRDSEPLLRHSLEDWQLEELRQKLTTIESEASAWLQ